MPSPSPIGRPNGWPGPEPTRPDGRGERVRTLLREAGIAVRRGDTFPGLGPDHVRVAVRPAPQVARLAAVLADALMEVGA